MTMTLRDLAREHGACRSVTAEDLLLDRHRRAALDRRHRLGDELAVEHVVDRVLLALGMLLRNRRRNIRTGKQLREIEPFAFQWSTPALVSSRSVRPVISVSERKPMEARISRTCSATKKK